LKPDTTVNILGHVAERESARRLMLRWINKAVRCRLACASAALYALCVLVPAAASAFAGAAAHCLTETGPAHVHRAGVEPVKPHIDDDGPAHSHAASSPHEHAGGEAPHDRDAGGESGGNCCGLFCVSAIGQRSPDFTATRIVATHAACALAVVLTGRSPDRIDRPPIG
jgi:hypothetical protein